ncbi:MAG: hypothetical protein K8R21_07030 [Leptospira sp.]|nr:hypothetical protein [Leptospira sp.]
MRQNTNFTGLSDQTQRIRAGEFHLLRSSSLLPPVLALRALRLCARVLRSSNISRMGAVQLINTLGSSDEKTSDFFLRRGAEDRDELFRILFLRRNSKVIAKMAKQTRKIATQ